MRKKDFIKIINEEIAQYDFLNNDKYLAEQENVELLSEEYFQKQFIIDSITRMKDKIKKSNEDMGISYIDPELGESPHNDLNVEYGVDIEYKYQDLEEPVKFSLYFYGDNVGYTTEGWYDPGRWAGTMADSIEPSGEHYITSVDWWDIKPMIYTEDGEEIELKALEKEPSNVQDLFIRAYLEDAIINRTGYDIQEKRPAYESPPNY